MAGGRLLPGSILAVVASLAATVVAGVPAAAQSSFPHGVHADLFPLCSGCHDMTGGTARVFPSPQECAACHDGRQEPRVAWSGPDSAVVGGRRFDHAAHAAEAAEAGVRPSCGACHRVTAEGTVALERPAGAACHRCHADSHRADERCRTCHARPPAAEHPRAVHTSCAGAGCHSASLTDRLAPTREFCLLCHRDRTDHHPGERCARCHLVNPVGSGAGGG